MTSTPTRTRVQAPIYVAGSSERFGLQISVFGAVLGFQLFQGFSLANIAQIVAVVLLIPAWKLLSPRDSTITLLICISIAISPIALYYESDVPPIWSQVVFFVLCIIQIALSIRIATHVDARTILRKPINLAAFFLVGVAAYQYVATSLPYPNLLFDDKAHGATSAFCLAMLVLWVNDGIAKTLLALLVYFAGITTASRTILLGAPFLAITLLIEYRHSRAAAETGLKVYLHHLALLGIPFAAYALGGGGLAKGLTSRVSGADTGLAQSSSSAHVELARMATQLKVSDPLITFFGTGPGGFAAGVRTHEISTGSFAYYDPGAYQVLMTGFAPIHSATLSILVEFPLWVALAFVGLMWSMGRRLWDQQQWTLLMLLGGLLVTTSFYSSHNEYFYTAYICVMALVAFRTPAVTRESRRGRRTSVSHR